MAFTDLRDFIEKAKAIGELRVVEGADWNLEIGVLTELACHHESRPAILFDKIKGYPEGYQVLANSLGSLKRTALTLDLPDNLGAMDFIRAWREKSKSLKMIPPRVVKTGPLMENVYSGKEINMLKFPTPLWHEHDGGRYLGTGSIDITRDPDEGWVNLGTYRVMVHNEDTLGFYISPGKHGRIQREKYFNRNESCKVAVSFGHDPRYFLAGSIELDYGLSEYDFIGALKGSPVDVIDGDYSGLPIPADAEIVIEGEALASELMAEGPFGEWTGYYASSTRPEPIIKVKRLYHRNNPIILGSPPMRPPSELTAYRSYMRSALIWEEMERAGIPDVKGVWCHEAGGTRLLVIVSIQQRYPGHAKQAGVVASQCHAGAYLGRYVIVVDEDIDPSNTYDVLWAMSTRSDPEKDIDILRRCWSGPLDPIIPKALKGFNSRAIIDATRPFEWKDEFPRVAESSPELREKVRKKWEKVLFG
ncbi:MAG TPA: UbiD family decarboxylase [bacterium]|nr:UbiD family decarboxylase [bacterium]